MGFGDILDWLVHYGYLPRWMKGLDSPLVHSAVQVGLRFFQKFSGLQETGNLDPLTAEVMSAPRCGVCDVMPLTTDGSLPARWRKTDLTYRVMNYLPASIVPQSVQDDVFSESFGDRDSWCEHLEMKWTRVPSDRQADMTILCQRIDGPGNVLAQCELATGRDNPLRMWIDSGEVKWGLVKGSREANLFGTVKHELGHGVGLGHLSTSDALMYAYSQTNVVSPQAPDIQAALRLGYARRTQPTPPTPEPPTDKPRLIMEFAGKRYTGLLEPV